MATYPNGGLITETNAQYYAGQQAFPSLSAALGVPITISGWNLETPAVSGYGLFNFNKRFIFYFFIEFLL